MHTAPTRLLVRQWQRVACDKHTMLRSDISAPHIAGVKRPCLFRISKKASPQGSMPGMTAPLHNDAKLHWSYLIGVRFLAWKCFIHFSFAPQSHAGSSWFVAAVKVHLNQITCETVRLKWIFFTLSPVGNKAKASHCSSYPSSSQRESTVQTIFQWFDVAILCVQKSLRVYFSFCQHEQFIYY